MGRTGEAEGSESDKLRSARDRHPRLAERRNRDEGGKEDWRGCPLEGAGTRGTTGITKEVDQARSLEEYFQEAVEAFAQLRNEGGLEEPVLLESGAQNVAGTMVEDWLWLFLRIVDSAALRQQLKYALDGALQGRTKLIDPADAGPQYV